MIIDAHTHTTVIQGRLRTPDELLQSMDEATIDHALVITDILGGPWHTTDGLIEQLKMYPRLHPIGRIDFPTLGSAQINQLLTWLRQGNIGGVKIYAGYEDYYPTDERLFPLYEACQSEGFPIVIHTGVLMLGVAGLLKQAQPLLVDELAQLFPKLKIVMAHFGNPWIVDCAAVVAKNPNVYIDLSGFFIENAPISREDATEFVEALKTWRNFSVGDFKRCLFGTDWPLYSQKDYLHAVQQLPLSQEEHDLVFWKNASQLYHLGLEA